MLTAILVVTTSFSMGVGLGAAFGAMVGAATGAVGAGAGGAGGTTAAGAGVAAIASSPMAGGALSTGARQNHIPAEMLAMVSVTTRAIHNRLCSLELLEVWA